MTAIDFPNSPTVGDVFSAGDRSWEWTGAVWKSVVEEASNVIDGGTA